MKFSLLSTVLATLVLAIAPLSGQAASPGTGAPSALPTEPGAWTAELAVSFGPKHTFYKLSSTGTASVADMTYGSSATSAAIAPDDLEQVAAAIAVARPDGWQTIPFDTPQVDDAGQWTTDPQFIVPHRPTIASEAVYSLTVDDRMPNGTAWQHTAEWYGPNSIDEASDARAIADTMLQAFRKAQGK